MADANKTPETETARFRSLNPAKSYALYSPDGDEIARGHSGALVMQSRWEAGTEAYEEPARCIDDDGEPLPADEIAE